MANKKILIIDDEPQDRKSIELILSREGFDQLAFAVNGQDGLEQIQSFRPDIAIIDVVLPDMDGFDLCFTIKKHMAVAVKVFMLTGHLDAVNVKKARISGADEILEKRANYSGLIKIIATLSGV